MLSRLVLILFCSLSLGLSAQHPYLKHYGIAEGLPSTEVHDIHQDQKGYIWLATDHGLVRYDGQSFKVYSIQDGLTDNTIFNIAEDDNGVLWLSTYSNGVSYGQDGQFAPHPNNELIREISKDYYITYFEIEEDGSIDFNLALSNHDRTNVIHLDNSGNIQDNSNEKHDYKEKVLDNTITENDLKEYVDKILKKEVFVESHYDYLVGRHGRIFINMGNALYVYFYENKSIVQLIEGRKIQRLWEDDQGDLWVGFHLGGGLQKISFKGQDHQFTDFLLPGMTITDIIQDREGNFWISTIEEGVYFLAQPAISYFPQQDGLDDRTLALITWDHSLWVGNYDGGIIRIDQNKRIKHFVNKDYHAPIFTFAANEDYLFTGNNFLFHRGRYKYVPFTVSSIKTALAGANNQFWIGGIWGLNYFQADNPSPICPKIAYAPRSIYSLWIDEDQLMWMGALSGLYTYDGLDIKPFYHDRYAFRDRVTDISSFGSQRMAFATKGAGLLLYYQDSLQQIDESNGLNSVFVKSILVQNDSTIWVGGNKGLNRIQLCADDFWTVKRIDSYDISDGIPSDEIFDIEWFDEQIWLATSQGLCAIKPDLLKVAPPPIVQISQVYVNQQERSLTEIGQLRPFENNIEFHFVGLHFRKRAKVKYRYRLLGYDEKMQEAELGNIRYTNLPAGSYQLHIWAATPNENWTEQAKVIKFQIRQYFYKQYWFISLAVLAVAFIIWQILSYFNRRQREKNELERKIIQSEQTALRAQINPHFVFNAMNSIQYFVTENDRHHAGIYLSRFSKLIRRILENSKKNWISLEEEIEGLQHYLELEQLRFINKFDYEIYIDPDLDSSEVEIPAMMIQPLLENAIWHGLAKKEEHGLLELHFIPKNDQLCCIIRDNGIGRKMSNRLKKSKQHKSTGISNIIERMELLNQQHQLNMNLSIEDLVDEQQQSQGTRVTLYFTLFLEL